MRNNKLKSIVSTLVLLIVSTTFVFSQNYYRSKKSGAYNSASTWQSSNDSITWINAISFPNSVLSSVLIQSTHNVTPTTSSIINVKNLTLMNSSLLTLGFFKTFIINGNLTNNGTLNHNNSTVSFNGSTNNFINGSSLTLLYIMKVDKSIDNNTINVNNNIQIDEMLSFGTDAVNVLNITSTGLFTFNSTNTSSAHIDILSSPLPIMTGSYIVKRFFPNQGGRYNFMLGSPLNNANFSMLQPTTFDVNGYPTNGIFLTGPFSGANTAYSSFSYNPNTGLYSGIPKITNSELLTLGEGYRFSVRDGNSSVLTTVDKTLSIIGNNPAIGDFTFNNIVNVSGTKPFASGSLTGISTPITGGWNLVSNPYISDISIDLSSNWLLNNMSQTSYIYEASTKNFLACASGVPIENCIVPSFQGFWVQANGSNPSLTINETAKVSTQNTTSMFRVSNTIDEELNYFGITLINSSSNLTNKTYIRYKNGSVIGDDEFDGYKLGVNEKGSINQVVIYTKSKDIFYDVNSKPLFDNIDTTELYVISKIGSNILNFSDINNLNSNYVISLYDKYLNKLSNVTENPLYNFNVSIDSSTFGNRFMVIVNKKQDVVTSTTDIKIENNINIFPKPFLSSNKSLTIVSDISYITKIVITNIDGTNVYNKNYFDTSVNINDLNFINKGLYIIKVYTNDNKLHAEKIIYE